MFAASVKCLVSECSGEYNAVGVTPVAQGRFPPLQKDQRSIGEKLQHHAHAKTAIHELHFPFIGPGEKNTESTTAAEVNSTTTSSGQL